MFIAYNVGMNNLSNSSTLIKVFVNLNQVEAEYMNKSWINEDKDFLEYEIGVFVNLNQV